MERMREKTPVELVEHCTCPNTLFWASWKNIVETFSSQLLTNPKDKLPAIAGLAQKFRSISGDRYLAGLWESRLLHDLMWKVEPPLKSTTKQPWRRLAWRAPSWSWASLDARLEVIGPHKRVLQCQLSYAEVLTRREVSEILCAFITPQDPLLPLGPVQDGSITIRGPLRKATLRQGRLFRYLCIENFCLTPAVSDASTLESEAFAKPTLDMGFASESQDFATTDDCEVWCLQMREETVRSRVVGGEATIMDGLLLLPIDEAMAKFRRVGVWVTDWYVVVGEAQNPFAAVANAQITIV